MQRVELTVKSLRARPVIVPLKRPIVSKVGVFREWPMILIDLETNEGVVGRSYLEPYLKHSLRYLVAALEDLGAAAVGKPVAPFDLYRQGIGSLHLVGREGLSLIAISGLDMAAWDARAQAAGLRLRRTSAARSRRFLRTTATASGSRRSTAWPTRPPRWSPRAASPR